MPLNGRRLPRLTRRSPFAQPDAGARITAERVEMSLRLRFDPLPTLNPRLLVRYLQEFDYGYLEWAARTWDAMERRDDRLASVADGGTDVGIIFAGYALAKKTPQTAKP